MKVVKALLVWLISIPVCAIAWVVSVFYFIFVIPYKEYNRVLYGVKIPKIKRKVFVKKITKDELLDMLRNDMNNEKKGDDKNIKDTDKMS